MGARRFILWCLGTAALVMSVGCSACSSPLVDGSQCPPGSSFDLDPYGLSPYVVGQPDTPFKRQTVDTGLFPNALCNDGSPAVFYFRPADATYPAGAATPAASTEWFIFLDGGGGCADTTQCFVDRWCGNGRVFEVAGKMSSVGAWDAIASPGGIFDQTPGPLGMTNPIAERNQVFVHYCSSDIWIGSEEYVGIFEPTTGVQYDIQFQGEAIVNGVFEMLLAPGGVAGDLAGAAGEPYPEGLPSLADATDILLGGESAGGSGLRHHLDRLAGHLDGAICPPTVPDCDVEIRAVIDAAASPPLWDGHGVSWADPGSPSSYADYLTSESEPRVRDFWGAEDSTLDASCLDPTHSAAHLADGGLHPEVCYDTTYTLEKHITTPVFLRQDINDPLAKELYDLWMLFPSSMDYMVAQHDMLLNLGNAPLEPGFASFDRGVLGTKCDEHVMIQLSGPFFQWQVDDPAYPTPLPFDQLLLNWLAGTPAGPDTRQIQGDDPTTLLYDPSTCP